MSDFGANTSDFDSDFRAGLSDYASDFRDFTGDSGSDFGREVRHSGSRTAGMDGAETAAAYTAPPYGHKRGCKLSAQAASHGHGDNAHATRQ